MADLQLRFKDDDLDAIVEAAFIYMCACPAQVAQKVKGLRSVIRYQENCLKQPEVDAAVHEEIYRSTILAHALMEDCLDTVLTMEKWDRNPYTMPEGLRQLRDRQVAAERTPIR